ncbi:glycoside hydrolase family 6 protein [Streptomyces botrytidirepellens]|uniref:Glucanase n=1 Tax=Streptomyces botrytidirepellens TaxID=2486417 RepID=A0A3M8UL88_9ACTN|nr:glycoside hydrolase family 6 protein [Streptomyces botrytidirepellens]RNG04481.1 endoglucanase [Streptomyces botrytidirepellens]
MREKDPRKSVMRRLVTVAACGVVAMVVPLSGCQLSDSPPRRGGLWVNPDGPAARHVREREEGKNGSEHENKSRDAALIDRIARQPVAEWLGPQPPRERVRSITESAARTGTTPVLVAYNIPHRDCGGHSAGGAANGAAYRRWIEQVALGIGDRKALVVLEPDAVAQVVDRCVPRRVVGPRLALLRDAVAAFAALPRVRVYLDAGHAGWIKNPARLMVPLLKSGIEQADGFSLNVANFQRTGRTKRYGHRLSRAVGGAHFVIDTSRNGNGPLRRRGATRHGVRSAEAWCNPPGRALGEPPSTHTGDRLVDAYLWIKRPGESDGTCNGGPPAGRWWPEYALGLARNAHGPGHRHPHGPGRH